MPLTYKEMQSFIKEKAPLVQQRIKEYQESGVYNEVYQDEIDYLKNVFNADDISGIKGATGNKALVYQKQRELENFLQMDYENPIVQALEEEKFNKAYQTFIHDSNGKIIYDLNKEEYRQLVETMGALKDDLKDFGSEQVVNLMIQTRKENGGSNVNIVKLAIETLKSKKGKGSDVNANVKALRKAILNELGIDKFKGE